MHELRRIIEGNERKEGAGEREKEAVSQKCALYGRVSTYTQKKRGDLEVQVDAMKRYCHEHGLSISRIYKDMGSGLNTNRRALWKLINNAKKGRFNTIVVNYKDRLTKFGFRYLKEYLEEFDVNIVAINKFESKSIETELVEDLVAIIQSFSGRLYGLRSHGNKNSVASVQDKVTGKTT